MPDPNGVDERQDPVKRHWAQEIWIPCLALVLAIGVFFAVAFLAMMFTIQSPYAYQYAAYFGVGAFIVVWIFLELARYFFGLARRFIKKRFEKQASADMPPSNVQ